ILGRCACNGGHCCPDVYPCHGNVALEIGAPNGHPSDQSPTTDVRTQPLALKYARMERIELVETHKSVIQPAKANAYHISGTRNPSAMLPPVDSGFKGECLA